MDNIGIIKTAHYLASQIQTNEELCRQIKGLTPEKIIEKTGIKCRYHISKEETASSMAINVAQKLITGINPSEIGLIIIASFSQDYLFPPMSAKIHNAIGASKDCQIIDINVNCVGLITGTTIAIEKMKNSNIKYSLIIGVEILSQFIGDDKYTATYFSDGASGVLLGRVKEGGYFGSKFATDSSVYEAVRLQREKFPDYFIIEHDGKTTWTQAITYIPYVIKELIKNLKLELEDINFFIFHQANGVLINYILDKLKIPRFKTYTNVEEIGNTGAASIGIALDEAISKELIKKGNLVMLIGVGAGFNFGANLWKI